MVDRRRAYTAIFLKGEPPKIFPTSDAEHARILQLYKQDRPHEGILNDFSDYFPPPDAVRAEGPPKENTNVKGRVGKGSAKVKEKATVTMKTTAEVKARGRASAGSSGLAAATKKKAKGGKRSSGGSSHRVVGEAVTDGPLWILVAEGASAESSRE